VTGSDLQVAHALPGRIRLKLDALRGNPSLADEVERAVATLRGMCDVEANPVTGSLLMHYDAAHGTSADIWQGIASALAGRATKHDAHVVATHLTTHARHRNGSRPHHARHVRQAFEDLNQRVAETTGGLDLALLVPAVLVALGLRSFLFSEQTAVPRWYDFLWFGFGAFMMLNAAGVPPAKAVEEAAELAAEL
jgi:hypothetical protein